MNGLSYDAKGPGQVVKLDRNKCTLHRLPRSLEMSDYIKPYQ